MTTIENTQQGTINFVAQRLTPWTENAAALTLTEPDTTQLAALLDDAEAKFADAKEAWNQYRAKVDAQDESIAALYDFASLLVQQIRVAAKKDGTNLLYQLAQIAPPKDRSPRSEAPIPTNLSTDTTTSGDVVLTFKGAKTGGAVFEVQRQLVPIGELPGPWQPLGTFGDKEYVDQNVPTGLAQINYRVRTVLTTGILSEWSYPGTFYFGSGNQATQQVQAAAQSAQAESTPEGGDGETITIEDAQALKDAQTAKGKDKAG